MSRLSTRQRRHQRERQEAIQNYGGCCAICGETTLAFLAIDHISGGGKQHLLSINTPNIIPWLRARKHPPGFRVLCHNHNYLEYCLRRPASVSGRRKRYRSKLRAAVLAAYGRRCACCGLCDERLLTIDHINDTGASERRHFYGAQNRGTGTDQYRRIRSLGFPPGYQLACWNCNTGRSVNGGVCPHKDTGSALEAQDQGSTLPDSGEATADA